MQGRLVVLLPVIVMFDASAAQDTCLGAYHHPKKSFYEASALLCLQLGIVQPLLREVSYPTGKRGMLLERSLCCGLLIAAGMNHLPNIAHFTVTLLISSFAPFTH